MAPPTKLLSALLLLATAAAVAVAARPGNWERGPHSTVEAKLKGDNLSAFRWIIKQREQDEQDEQEEGNKAGKRRAYVAIRYEVEPSLQDKFLEEWKRVEDGVEEEKDNIIYDLKKTQGDNLYWIVYGEWKDFRAYYDHFTSDYVEGWLDFLAKYDVIYDLHPLDKVTDDAQELAGRSEDDLGRRRRREDAAHVLINYHVPPSKVEDFIDAWEDVAEATAQEKENSIYSLRKVATNNHHFYVYGTWDSFGAYLDHFESDHIRKLRDFAADNDLIWFLEPLKKYGKQRED